MIYFDARFESGVIIRTPGPLKGTNFDQFMLFPIKLIFVGAQTLKSAAARDQKITNDRDRALGRDIGRVDARPIR